MEILLSVCLMIGKFCFGAVSIIAILGFFFMMFYYYKETIDDFELGKIGVTMLAITYIVICLAGTYQTYIIARYVLS